MVCYIGIIKEPSKADYELWKSQGYIGTWDDYLADKWGDVPGQTYFMCGDESLGPHCADCAGFGDFLCDYPVGDNKTCDRSMCDHHATEIAPEIHYCAAHNAMWEKFKKRGGVRAELKNVIAFKPQV